MAKTIANKIITWIKVPFTSDRYSHAPDYVLLGAIGILLLFGILMLSSASTVIAFQSFGDSYHFVKHQLLYGILPGMLLFLVAIRMPYVLWKKFAFWMLAISVGLLILVLIPGIGKTVGGATRWIDIGIFKFQPSEIVKMTFLIYLSTWLAKKGSHGS